MRLPCGSRGDFADEDVACELAFAKAHFSAACVIKAVEEGWARFRVFLQRIRGHLVLWCRWWREALWRAWCGQDLQGMQVR